MDEEVVHATSTAEREAADPRRVVRSLFPPDFEFCGGCAGKTRVLTEPEATRIVEGLAGLLGRFPALSILDGLTWPLEINDRVETCRCETIHRDHFPDDGFFVYRLWTADNRLFYIGSTVRLTNRIRTHRRRWPELFTTVTWESFESPAAMLAAESEAIAAEYPAMNKRGV